MFILKETKAMYAYYTGGDRYSWDGIVESELPMMRDGNEILTMKLEFKEDEANGSLSIKINYI